MMESSPTDASKKNPNLPPRMSFWNHQKPTVADVAASLDKIEAAALQLDKVFETAATMGYVDAMWIAQRAYKLGSFLKICARDAYAVPHPIDEEEAKAFLDKVQRLRPIVLRILTNANAARDQFDQLFVVEVVKIQLRWLAAAETEFSHAALSRSPTQEIADEAARITTELDEAFEKTLNIYGTSGLPGAVDSGSPEQSTSQG